MRKKELSRREVLKNSLAGVAGLAAVASQTAMGNLAVCKLTPAQGEGPFYPEADLERDSDLTQLTDGAPKAKGDVIYITGSVTDVDCRPIAGALVEIWQAAATGKYNHSEDLNPLEPDPNFQYWGRAHTRADGKFLFKTIIPGHYPVGGGRFRPPHIHYKVHAAHHVSLTTQMYFDPMSYDDLELRRTVDRLNKAEGVDRRLMVLFKDAGAAFEAGSKLGTFDLSVRRT